MNILRNIPSLIESAREKRFPRNDIRAWLTDATQAMNSLESEVPLRRSPIVEALSLFRFCSKQAWSSIHFSGAAPCLLFLRYFSLCPVSS